MAYISRATAHLHTMTFCRAGGVGWGGAKGGRDNGILKVTLFVKFFMGCGGGGGEHLRGKGSDLKPRTTLFAVGCEPIFTDVSPLVMPNNRTIRPSLTHRGVPPSRGGGGERRDNGKMRAALYVVV